MWLNKIDTADVIPCLVRGRFNRLESTLRGFKIRVVITETGTNAEFAMNLFAEKSNVATPTRRAIAWTPG